MDYQPRVIEKKWRQYWKEKETYKVSHESDKPKFYVLDMFPYPSGSGLHVGHPLGYIASDIFSRFKRLKGFNVLHPMGYDAFGLPAEQYAIQRGVHPAISTAENIERYREQLDNLGFDYDWSRQVKTSDPNYYKWTQWIFIQLFEHYYNQASAKAETIVSLVAQFEKEGNAAVKAATTQEDIFTAEEWNAMSPAEQDAILMNYRLAYRKKGFVNWCEALGTVLANDEVKDGLSERGAHPVEKRAMLQWSLRITAYAERLLRDMENLEWSDALKAMQRNWIGRSEGAQLFFKLEGNTEQIEVFTTRPDTIFGATYIVLAPEHDLVSQLTTDAQRIAIEAYQEYVNARSERERMSEVKEVTGAFTGAYAINPFTQERIPIWIGEYVLKDYGTGAIMAVPSDDDRDHAFAEKFDLPIIEVIDKSAYPGATRHDKLGKMINSGFLDGMEVPAAIEAALKKIEEMAIGVRKVNYRLRDANYSRQRYWGEPFPVFYDENGVSKAMDLSNLPLELPDLEDFKPASGGKSPLARKTEWVNFSEGYERETDTMPGFAGSSWYFFRYMDPNNSERFASEDALNYWREVDLYVGGTEHAVGHLMYSRFWNKFLFDKGLVPSNEPFKKLINQGMIQGRSNFVYRANEAFAEVFFEQKMKDLDLDFHTEFPVGGAMVDFAFPEQKLVIELKNSRSLARFVEEQTPMIEAQGFKLLAISVEEIAANILSFDTILARVKKALKGEIEPTRFDGFTPNPAFISLDEVSDHRLVSAIHVDINLVDNDILDVEAFKASREEYANAIFVLNEQGKYKCGHLVEKMSKSKYNVQNPDDLVEKYGADALRMFEMFLGPIEQSKPWDTKGIDGVSKFLRRFWGLFFNEAGELSISEAQPTKEELKVAHLAIKKVNEDIERFSFNTCVSGFMVAANDLRKLNCNKRAVLEDLVILIAPFAPHMAEELWHLLGHQESVTKASYPVANLEYLQEDSVEYPVCVNGKKRALASFAKDASKEDMEQFALNMEEVKKWTTDKTVRKVIVVPGRMINVVVG